MLPEKKKIKAQEWIVQFNGNIKRTEKIINIDSDNNEKGGKTYPMPLNK